MIFYFSGTGNSQKAARQIAEAVGDEIISINQCLREGKRKTFRSETPLVFVTPTYAWRMPRVVSQWILENRFEGNGSALFVLTCGGNGGNAASYAKKLCKKKGLDYCGLATVLMPENYIALYPAPDEAECREIMEKAEVRIAKLAEQIKRGSLQPESVSFRDILESGPVNTIYYPLIVHDRGFTVSEKCVSCGKCAARCPLNNISMENGKPVWNGKCTHCMACIGGCPVKAIDYNKKTADRRQYFIMED